MKIPKSKQRKLTNTQRVAAWRDKQKKSGLVYFQVLCHPRVKEALAKYLEVLKSKNPTFFK